MRISCVMFVLISAAGPVLAQGWEDDFGGKTLDPRWQWRVPATGPTLSLGDEAGWLRIQIPERAEGFNHWSAPEPVDDAPQLRTAAPQGDWELEARVRLQQFDATGQFQAGLMVGASDSWLLSLGAFQAPGLQEGPKTPEVWLEPTGSSGFFRVPGDALDVWLQIVRTGSICRARMSRDGSEWVEAGACFLPHAPEFVGIIGKTFSPGPMAFGVDYIRLRPLDGPAKPLRVGVGGTYPTGYHGMFARLGLPHEVLLDYQLANPEELRRFDLLFIGAMSGGIEERAQQVLMQYVRDGGLAVLDASAFPPPSVVAGEGGPTSQIPGILVGGADNPLAPLVKEKTRLEPGESRFHFEPASEAGLQVLARFDGRVTVGGQPEPAQGYTGSPAVWAHPLGRGLFVYSSPAIGASLSWGPTLDPLADALARLLGGGWFEAQLVPEGVRLGRMEVAPSGPDEEGPDDPEPAELPAAAGRQPSSPQEPLPEGATPVEGGPAPEFNVSGGYHPDRGRAELLLNYWSRSFLVRVAFGPARVDLTCTKDGKVVETAQIPLGGPGPWPFLVKERKGRIALLVGSRQAGIGDGTLWEGNVASTGAALDDLLCQPVDPPYFSDDFMRGEGKQGAWEPVVGDWETKAEGDPKLGVNPFNYHGQAQGVGLSTTGWSFWDDYTFSVSVRPTQAGTVGQAFYYQDERNHLLFRARVRDAPAEEKGGFELVRVADGGEQVLAQSDGCLVTGQWYRLSVEARQGAIAAGVDGESIASAEERTLPGGQIALYLRDGQAEFDDVEVHPAAEDEVGALAKLDGSVPPFAGTLDRDTWAGTALQWSPERDTPGLFWRRGRFYGDFELAFRCDLGEGLAAPAGGSAGANAPGPAQPSLALLLSSEAGGAVDGYEVTLRAPGKVVGAPDSGAQYAYSVELARQGEVVKRAEVTSTSSPVVALRRVGASLRALVDDHQVLEAPLEQAAGELSRLGFLATGFRPRLSGLTLSAANVLDYCFGSAPTDWWVSSGSWTVSSRWPCTAEWSWFGGQSEQVAAIWHKQRFAGDITLDSHVGPWEIDHGDGTPREICRAFNMVLCGDGEDVHSGYSFVLGADKAGAGATLSRAGEVVARNPEYRIFSDAHNQWLNVRAEKRGPLIGLWVGDQQILSWHDPDPLPGGRVGIWTEDNGIMIPRVTIYSQETGKYPTKVAPASANVEGE